MAKEKAGGLGRRVKAALAAAALVASQALGMIGPMAQVALAQTQLTFANGGTATLNDDGTITGVATLHGGYLDDDGYYYGRATMPDGQDFSAGCYNMWMGWADHAKYAGPCNGQYSFTAKPQEDGSYFVVINSDSADGPCSGALAKGQYGPYGLVLGYQMTYAQGWRPVFRGKLSLTKSSANEGVTAGNGCYSLEGAEYGVYRDAACSDRAATLTTDAAGRAGAVELDAGTYWVREEKAPRGYLKSDEVKSVSVGAGQEASVAFTDEPGNDPARMMVQKVDSSTGEADPLAKGTLAGAEFTVRYYDGYYDEGNLPEQATRTWVFKTDSNGATGLLAAEMDPDKYFVAGDEFYKNPDGRYILPLGTVTVQETKAPEGYLLGEQPLHVSQVTLDADQQRVNGYVSADAEHPTEREQVKRGDISFVKEEGGSGARMSNVAFLIESMTTGEKHVVATDENGMFSTSSDMNKHSERTNGNDEALSGDGTVDSSKLDPSAGVWFSGAADKQTDPDDGQGALPYDDYKVTELRCSANENHELVGTTVSVTRDSVELDLGTFTDTPVAIGTELSLDGEHTVPCASEVEVTDTISYEGLIAGKEYTARGELHAVGEDGSDEGVVARTEQRFTADTSWGTAKVGFSGVNTSELSGKKLVAFEELWDGSDNLANHKDLSDEGQTVSVPGIGTELSGDVEHEADGSADKVELTDHVSYKGAVPGATYTVRGTLHVRNEDGTDGGALTDAGGNPVTASAEFRAGAASGEADIKFTFAPSGAAGKTVVAFEELSIGAMTYARHEDISDEGQTVRFPAVETSAAGAETGDHDAAASDEQRIVDTVKLSNLTVDKSYHVRGTLHLVGENGEDAGEVTDENGDAVTAETDLTAEASEQSVDLTFTVDASRLGGKTVVAFEELSRDGVRLGTHADISDEAQSVKVPAIGTTLTDEHGAHDVQASVGADGRAVVTLTDEVAYSNLIAGKTYGVEAELHVRNEDGTDGGAVELLSGEVAADDAADGSEEMGDYLLTGAGQLEGMGDEAKDALKQALAAKLAEEGAPSGSEAKVTAAARSGEDGWMVGFTVANRSGSASFDGKSWSVSLAEEPFWQIGGYRLYGVAGLASLPNDAKAALVQDAQAKLGEEGVPAESRVEATSCEVAGDSATLTLLVGGEAAFDGVWDGEKWTFTAHAADKVEPATKVSGTLTPTTGSGTYKVTLTFDAAKLSGRDVVAFERLCAQAKGDEGGEAKAVVASHEDISDEGQTVNLLELGTHASDAADGDQEVAAAKRQTVVDEVSYKNLVIGREYTVRGTLHVRNEDGTDGGALTDASGEPISAEATFTPEQRDGTVRLEFNLDASELDGKTAVAFEGLYQDNVKVGGHEDISNEGQSVRFTAPSEPGTPFPQTGGPRGLLPMAIGGCACAAACGVALAMRRRKLASTK